MLRLEPRTLCVLCKFLPAALHIQTLFSVSERLSCNHSWPQTPDPPSPKFWAYTVCHHTQHGFSSPSTCRTHPCISVKKASLRLHSSFRTGCLSYCQSLWQEWLPSTGFQSAYSTRIDLNLLRVQGLKKSEVNPWDPSPEQHSDHLG